MRVENSFINHNLENNSWRDFSEFSNNALIGSDFKSCGLFIEKGYKNNLVCLLMDIDDSFALLTFDFQTLKMIPDKLLNCEFPSNVVLDSFQGSIYLISYHGADFDYKFKFLELDLSKDPATCQLKLEKNVTFSKIPFKLESPNKIKIVHFNRRIFENSFEMK